MHPELLPDHPQAAQEYAQLQTTCDLIENEIAKLEKETGVGAEEERDVAVPKGLDADEQVALNLFRMKLDTLHNLARSRRQAYFARLDFIPRGEGLQTHYIGRWGVVQTPQLEIAVVDWRSPVANLYYAGQVGPMDYEAPDGRVVGELTLKRMLTVRQRKLEGIFDSGVVSQDAYLQGVLGAVTGDRLREIVTTIQSEQNLVIRHPYRRSLIVQGAAGSGKTTIALHRIAYLLYAHRQTLFPENMMILAPNPLFLSYISQVLPDLGVERVRQTTFVQLCQGWMGANAPKILTRAIEDKLSASPAQRARMARVARRKGSLAFMESLEAYLEQLQYAMLPAQPLTFGQATLMSVQDFRDMFLHQLRPWPLVRRVQEAKKVVKRRLDLACGQMRERLYESARMKLENILALMPDSPQRRERCGRLLDLRDQRLREIDERAKQYLKDFPTLFPALTIAGVYRDYLLACENEEMQSATLPLLEKGKGALLAEDLAAAVSIARALYGLPRESIRHVVMDECQDFSPCQLALLRRQLPGATFTLVGDLMQGIHADEGITSYSEWLGPVFAEKASSPAAGADLRELVTSYRSTVEIMHAAALVARRYPLPGQREAKPVLRHGSAPAFACFASDKERIRALEAQARSWLGAGYHTIALVEKTAQAAQKLLRALSPDLNAHLLTPDDPDYTGGVVVSAGMIKGLEFDCAALCNANADAFPDDEFHCRLLYVMMTRPLHSLAVFACGELSPLLAQAAEEEEGHM